MKKSHKFILLSIIILSLGSIVYYHITFKPSKDYLSKQQKLYIERTSDDKANEMIESESNSVYYRNIGTIIFFSILVIAIFLGTVATSRLPKTLYSILEFLKQNTKK